MHFNSLSLLALLPITSAHFTLNWPSKRGFDDAKATGGPCGGFDSVSNKRTEFPINGGPVQLDLHHTQTRVAVYLALGNNPSGDDYTITLVPQLSEEGPGNFCMSNVNIPSDLNITAGTNATIQVVTNGDPSGGLYQCGDITFINNTLSDSQFNDNCKNKTGVRITQQNMSGHPNETSSGSGGNEQGQSGSPPKQPGAATHATVSSWVLGVAGAIAFALI